MNTQMTQEILFVDDEANVLDGLRRRLRKQYSVNTAHGPEAGLDMLRDAGPFAVIVTDYNMPGMNGVEFLRRAAELAPDAVPIILTGQADLTIAIEALHSGRVFRFLNKPVDDDALTRSLDDALHQYNLVMSERVLVDELNKVNNQLGALNCDLNRIVDERTATIRRIHKFLEEISSYESLQDVADVVVQTTADMLGADRVSLMLPDGATGELRIAACIGLDPGIASEVVVTPGEGIAGQVFLSRKNMVVSDSNEAALHGKGYEGSDASGFVSHAVASASVAAPTGVVGVLNVTNPREGATFNDDQLQTLKAIGEAAATALLNQIRRQERDQARDAIIFAMARLAECRDNETGEHLLRVQEYCRVLATWLSVHSEKLRDEVDDAFVEDIVRSSPLHDIGKVGIPDRILCKPGRLTEEEFAIMKTHARIGGDTLREVVETKGARDFLKMAIDITYWHHERWDGRGYPDGLAGDDIPIAARIMAVADVYDALTSPRVYKRSMPHDEARRIICDGDGSQFDPEVVRAFLASEDQFRRLSLRFAPEFESGLDAA